MRIMTLNTWGGRAGRELLLSFFDSYKDVIDVFCLQEMYASPHEVNDGGEFEFLDPPERMPYGVQDLTELLNDFVPYFRPQHGDYYGLMMLVHKKHVVTEEGDVFVHRHRGFDPYVEGFGGHARNIQYVKLEWNKKPLTIINFHGLWNGKGKLDSEDRLEQSKNILNFTNGLKGEFVLCGDFNLLPETKSLQMFEEAGLQNLIKDFGVTSTRTSHYKKDVRYADYMFLTKGLKAKEFRVLPEEVSDHAALYLELA